MPFPTITEKLFSKSAFGIAKEAVFRTPVTPTSYDPFKSCTLEYDPNLHSPPEMLGVRSTHSHILTGDEKVGGALGAALYPVSGIPLLVASIGQDATANNGVFGTAVAASGTTANAGASTSFAATGVTSIALTGIVGTFAVGQSIMVVGSTDAVYGPTFTPDVVRITAFSTPTVTCTATNQIHTGTITVTVVGDSVVSGGGATTSTVTVTSGHGAYFTVNDIITIDVNGSSTTAESRKVTGIATDTLTVDTAFTYSHAANALVYKVATTGIFWHTIPQGDSPTSFTFEKNIANVESLQFPGCKVGKMTLQAPMGANACDIAADIVGAQLPNILGSPSAVTLDPSPPFIFKQATLNIFGSAHAEAYNHKLVIDNAPKEQRTYSGSGLPSFVTLTDLHVNGSFDAVWQNFDDATYGFFQNYFNHTEGDFNFLLQQPNSGLAPNAFIYWDVQKVQLSKATISPTPANIAIQTLNFEGRYAIEATNPTSIKLIVGVPSQYKPY